MLIQDNGPAWLTAPPDGDFPSPPVDTRTQSLPFEELTWENFERLVRRLVAREATISGCWIYGVPGQTQHGLDILADRHQAHGEYSCYQCKRVKEFTGEDIKKAVKKFLDGKWANKSKNFVLCTSIALSKTDQVDEIAAQHSLLAAKGIEFQVWDGSESGQLSERLKSYPDLVDDFFLREWVRRFNGEEAAKSLGEKLDGIELKKLRAQLHGVYATLFLRHDQGLRLGSQRPASLLNRYIAPAVIESRRITTSEFAADASSSGLAEQNSISTERQNPQSPRHPVSKTQEIRIPVTEWFSRHNRSVVLGDPGFGKSTLLRVIALQLLANRDDLIQTSWGELLPVWVSFGGFSSAIQSQPGLSLEDYFDRWLHQNAADDIRLLFKRAIRQGGMLLLIDGLDEGQDANAAKQAMDRISAFLAIHPNPAVLTSRPRGYERVRPDGTWPVTRLGTFDENQIEKFSNMWFEYLEIPSEVISKVDSENLQRAHQRTKDFQKAIQANPRIIELARTPLFCQLLIDIFRYSHHLPEQRIKVYEKIVEMLLSDHPAARIQAAGLSTHAVPRAEDMHEMLMHLALHIQESGGAGVISVADCQTTFCDFLTDDIDGPGLPNYEARHQAKLTIDYALTGLGLIVERSPNELGFFHLTIQEYLAAMAMVRKVEDEQLAWLVRVWNQPQWHEVVLAWFSIRGVDQGKGATQRAIDRLKEAASMPWEKMQFLLLRTELAANDLGLSPREARSVIEEAANQVETTPFQKLRLNLAGQIARGLSSPSVASICENRIANWLPARSEWDRANLIKAFGNWKPADDLLHTLKLALHDESVRCRLAAAESLAKVFLNDQELGNELAEIARNWPDTGVRAAALLSLWKGWPDHSFLNTLAENACHSMDMDLVLTGIEIRVSKGLRSEEDRQKIWHIFTCQNVSYELRGTCLRVLLVGWASDLEFKKLALDRLYESHLLLPSDKEVLLAFLAHSWPGDVEVAQGITDYFHAHTPLFIHEDSLWNSLFKGFRGTPALSAVIRQALNEQKTKYQSIHWGPDTVRAYTVIGDDAAKAELIDSYRSASNGQDKFWICSALIDAWSSDKDVRDFFNQEFLNAPGAVPFLANWAHIFITEQESRRAWLLEAARTADTRYISAPLTYLLDEFRDEECRTVVKEGISKDIWYYSKTDLQSKFIAAFPDDNDTQKWTSFALEHVDGPSVASLAIGHENHPEVRRKLLATARPVATDARIEVFRVMREHPIPPETIERLTYFIFSESDGAVRTSGVLARCIVAQQLPAIMEPLMQNLQEDLNSSGGYYERRRRSAFAGLLQLGQYETCVAALTQESPSSLHWLASYHEADNLTARTMFEHWDNLHGTAQSLGKTIGIPWDGLVYNGSASEALINSAARSQLVAYIKSIPNNNRSPESLYLMAELLPSSSELSTCLIETITSQIHRNDTQPEALRIYAEQFMGDEQALNELGNAWAAPDANTTAPSISAPSFIYALALGWPDNATLQVIVQQNSQSKLPIYIALALCGITGDEDKALYCIDRMIEVTVDNGRAMSAPYLQGLRHWAFTPSATTILNQLLTDPDGSRMITALRLLNISGRLENENRAEMIEMFNEYLDGAKNMADGIDIIDGQATSIAQVVAQELFIAYT
ncbi:MAG: NACHT domain-containing protein [Gammaproteobacteria bacterium]|nr:NACHT domain-containing protein [Gammaproteobacteria bacterium]